MEKYMKLTSRSTDIAGKVFGRLTALGPVAKNHYGFEWECLCECGERTVVRGTRLRAGEVRSCGCLKGRPAQHGMTDTSIFKTWSGMKARCSNQNLLSYQYYGERGISVCSEWVDSFEEFLGHVSKLPHFDEDGYTLDRIDTNGNYRPGNVRWATVVEQRRNQRRCRRITVDEVTRTAAEWSEISGISISTIGRRLDQGMSEQDAVFRPTRGARLITSNGVTRTLSEWGKLTGIPIQTIHSRITRGYSEDEATKREQYAINAAE